jgi:hypothetical protein
VIFRSKKKNQEMLAFFVDCSGVRKNPNKSLVAPISCTDDEQAARVGVFLFFVVLKRVQVFSQKRKKEN